LGINMPARSVVLERLVKWNGETHADVTPGEYTQLTGRAGRRGIDVEGHAVVVWSPGLEPAALGGLASTRTYPLRSSFRPSYNMAVNLVGQVGRDTARELLQSSFAQFQADRAVVGLTREVTRNEEALEGYREAMTCHLGDFAEYAGLRQAISAREASLARAGAADQRAQAAASLEALRPGDVIEVPAGRRGGLAVVLDPGTASGPADPRPTVLTAARQVRRLSLQDFPVPVAPLQRLRIPKAFNPRNPASRRDLAATLRNTGLEDRPRGRSGRARSAAADDTELASLRARLRTHPCHGCAEREDHARWAERYHRLARETEQLSRRVRDRTHTISRTFDRICGLLEELGYLHGDEVTASGRVLGTLYTELDLLAADCLLGGAWDGLGPADLAAVVSALVYESRRDEDTGPPRLPAGRGREVLEDTQHRWAALEARERAHRVPPPREPDPRFAWVTHQWASGRPLDAVLRDADNGQMAPGDFVRWTKQVVDLLGQIGDTGRAPGAGPAVARVAATARTAADLLRRGVVAYSSVA
jgi:ATP-dependent RNA helicase HelY